MENETPEVLELKARITALADAAAVLLERCEKQEHLIEVMNTAHIRSSELVQELTAELVAQKAAIPQIEHDAIVKAANSLETHFYANSAYGTDGCETVALEKYAVKLLTAK